MATTLGTLPTKTYVDDPIPQAQVEAGGSAKSIEDAAALVKAKVPGSSVEVVKGHPGDPFMVVKPEKIIEVLKTLRDDPQYLCQSLTVIGATDFLKTEAKEGIAAQEARIEVVYIVYSYKHRHQFTVKVKLPRENPSVPSVCSLFRAANWYERECYDMMGVTFEGHPNHKRILTSPDWVGHPLRKDYVFPEEYNGMKVPL